MTSAAERKIMHFDHMFAVSDDPWQTRSLFTEHAKRKAVLRLLGPDRFGSVLELGCGGAAFTVDLAMRCRSLSAIDGSAKAIDRASRRLAAFRHIRFLHRVLPKQFPAGQYDVIIASEILYYLSFRELLVVFRKIAIALSLRGRFIAVNHVRHFSDAASTLTQVRVAAARSLGEPARSLQAGPWRADVYNAI